MRESHETREPAQYRRLPARWLLIFVLVALVGQRGSIQLNEPLTPQTDVDGLAKLTGIAQHPTLHDALGYFVGDDPQRVHTFRPIPAFTLWLEWHVWGFSRWPYEIVSILWFALTALAVVRLCRRVNVPPPWALGIGLVMLLDNRVVNLTVLGCIATRHDVLCSLFCLLAFETLLAYLETGDRRCLASTFGWALAAYLSKEQALALVPLTFITAGAWAWRKRTWRRPLTACGVALLNAAVWLVWYRLAERQMGPIPHASHSLPIMVDRLLHPDSHAVVLMLYNLCWPFGDLARIAWADPTTNLFFSGVFRVQLEHTVIAVAAIVMVARQRPAWLFIVYAWKVCCYLPVWPLRDTWPWYNYQPNLLNFVLPVATLWCLIVPLGGGVVLQAARARWRAGQRWRQPEG